MAPSPIAVSTKTLRALNCLKRTIEIRVALRRAAVGLSSRIMRNATAARLRPTRISIVRLRVFQNFFTLLSQRMAKVPYSMSLLVTVRHVSEDIDLRPIRADAAPGPPRADIVVRFTSQASHLFTACLRCDPSRSRAKCTLRHLPPRSLIFCLRSSSDAPESC